MRRQQSLGVCHYGERQLEGNHFSVEQQQQKNQIGSENFEKVFCRPFLSTVSYYKHLMIYMM